MLRMIRLYPEQVARQWEIIEPAIEAALPPITTNSLDRMNRVFESILSGRLNTYMFVNETKVKGVVTVSVLDSVDSVEKQLLIYSLFGYKGVTIDELNQGFDLIADLARGLGCASIVAYTSLDPLREYVKRIGGDASLTFLRLEV